MDELFCVRIEDRLFILVLPSLWVRVTTLGAPQSVGEEGREGALISWTCRVGRGRPGDGILFLTLILG